MSDEQFDLDDKACDRIVELVLNIDIMLHHSLRRDIVRVAYEIGKAATQTGGGK